VSGEITITHVTCPLCDEVVKVLNVDAGEFVSVAAHGDCSEGWGFSFRYTEECCVQMGVMRHGHIPVSVYINGPRATTQNDRRVCPDGDTCFRCGAMASDAEVQQIKFTKWQRGKTA
jgi:hypothetical protein